jgi:hypothetical protein
MSGERQMADTVPPQTPASTCPHCGAATQGVTRPDPAASMLSVLLVELWCRACKRPWSELHVLGYEPHQYWDPQARPTRWPRFEGPKRRLHT